MIDNITYNLSVIAREKAVFDVKSMCSGLISNNVITLFVINLFLLFTIIYFYKKINNIYFDIGKKKFNLAYALLVLNGVIMIWMGFYLYNGL